MKKKWITLFVTAFLILATVGSALAANPNPGVIPNVGPKYGQLAVQWWLWAFSFPADTSPILNKGGPVDISAGQSGNIWFLAGAPWFEPAVERWGTVPSGTTLFFPLANVLNDYPCPNPDFKPPPGMSLEDFLLDGSDDFWGANDWLDLINPPTLFAKIIDEESLDEKSFSGLELYRENSSLFTFTADPALAATFDPCITGSPQQGVTAGYWVLLTPMTPGEYILHFGTPDWGQDVTYHITVTPNGH